MTIDPAEGVTGGPAEPAEGRGFRRRRAGYRDPVLSRDGGNPSAQRHHMSATAKEVAEHASALTRLEIELAGLELKRKANAAGVGAGMLAGAALLLLYALGFLLAAGAAALALELPWWASLLIVTGALVVVAAVVVLVGRSILRRATPPVPEEAIREAKLTTTAIKG
jgi:putative superfamily III holin-X